MTQTEPNESLSDEAGLALAYTPPHLRGPLQILFEFDARLSRLVAATSEPMLGQMRLAWWRETLGQPVAQRPQGDLVLDAMGREWVGQEAGLIAMVDGWEYMLTDPPLNREAVLRFAEGRAAGFAAFAALAQAGEQAKLSVATVGKLWAVMDAASHIGDNGERALFLEVAREIEPVPRLPKPLRGIAVLGALGTRALERGGRPLMEGRGAALTAMRAGLAGR